MRGFSLICVWWTATIVGPPVVAGQDRTPLEALSADRDANGVPARVGDTVRVLGVAVTDPFETVPGPQLRTFLSDATGGVRVQSSDLALMQSIRRGDSLTVVGVIGFYNGATNLEPLEIIHLGTGRIPDPLSVRVADLLSDRHEGRLVRVVGTLVNNQNVEIRDRTGSVRVRVRQLMLADPVLSGRLYSGQRAVVIGIADQFDPSPPHDAGYRIEILSPNGVGLRFDTRPWLRGAAILLLVGLLVWWGRAASVRAASTANLLKDRETLQGQLLQSQKLESLGHLAGGVAHDFNNLLAVILGHTEMALDEAIESGALRSSLLEIQKAAGRSADLTQQLLGFARQQPISPQVLDLNKTVGEMTAMLRRLIGENIDLAWEPTSQLWRVRIDEGQVTQILTNLCVNARDAIDGVGRIAVEVSNATLDETYCSRHPGSKPGDHVRLTVSDDGAGMDQEVASHVFDPFFTTKPAGKGTGLGLATVYGIVKQNHGSLNVYSELGRGTSFKVFLRRYVGDESAPEAPAAVKPDARGNETILLVEDEAAVLELVTVLLENLGYRVLTASSPSRAIGLATDHRGEIDLVLTDVIMPEMNGRELVQQLTDQRPELKVLYTSGYTADVIANHAVLDDGVNFLEKPFSRGALAMKVREALASGVANPPDASRT